MSRLSVVFVALLAWPGPAAFADPPSRVARISITTGSVSFRPGSLDEWNTATVNYPVSIGDHIWTDNGARTELQLGSSAVRLGPDTEFSVLNLDDRAAQLRITEGSLIVRVRTLEDGDTFEIDTPNGAVSLTRPGAYRVDVNEAGDASTITVRQGEADVSSAGADSPLGAGQSLMLSAAAAAPPQIGTPVPIDQFEDWSLARDRRSENVQAARYVSPDVVGYQDLDQYGDWQVMPEYGPVWVPRVRAEWVPYRDGQWRWVEPWGWTWIDDAPWGFAPFHYGRWTRLSAGWAWVPGTIVARPVYAPALVAFVGGPGFSASLAVGSEPVAWFPLGPREVFVPAYHVSPVYVQRINVSHVAVGAVTNVNGATVVYVNRDVPGAVTAVPRDVFVHAQPVARVAVAVPREAIRSATIVGTTALIVPERVSVAGERAAARVAVPPVAVAERHVVVRRTPPPVPAAFAARPAAPAVQTAPPVRQPLTPAPAAPAAPGAAASADLAARHAQERAQIDARHAAERAQLQARHAEEDKRATDAHQRQQLRQRHQQEMTQLEERQKNERDQAQRRQDAERRKGGG